MSDEEIVLPKIGVVVILRHGSKFLVSQRLKAARDFVGYLQFPGGTVRKGERLVDAALRELLEETGIMWSVIVHPPVYVNDSHLVSNNWMTLFYLINVPPDLEVPENPEPTKHLPWVWMEEWEIRRHGSTMPAVIDVLDTLAERRSN